MNNMEWLQDWYRSMCDGDWEHQHGIRIDTIDNPGWSIRISLYGVPFDGSALPIERQGDDDWVVCRIREDHFEAFGGPKNLDELIGAFRTVASKGQRPATYQPRAKP